MHDGEEEKPESFGKPSVPNQLRFPFVSEVGIKLIVALMGVMFQMINSKAHRAGNDVWEISENRDHLIPTLTRENEIVDRIVNQDIHGMIRESAYAISDEHTEPPVSESQLPENKSKRSLQTNDGKSYYHRPGITPHELANFRMRFDDSARPSRVRVT